MHALSLRLFFRLLPIFFFFFRWWVSSSEAAPNPTSSAPRNEPFFFPHRSDRMGQDERQDRQVAPQMEQEGERADEVVSCDYCSGARAVVYCRADSARLCLPCDRLVHGANAVCSRHARAPLCNACSAAGAVFRSGAAAFFLCSNCDFGRNRDGDPPLHDRCTVQGYTGRPSAHDLAAVLGVPDFEKPPADQGWWTIWEEPQVFSFEDLIVPTTSCHGFQPLVTPSSPKNQSSPDRKTNEEVIRQLRELAEADGGGAQIQPREEAEKAAHQLPSWEPSEYITGNGNFATENSHEVLATMPTPGYEENSTDSKQYRLEYKCRHTTRIRTAVLSPPNDKEDPKQNKIATRPLVFFSGASADEIQEPPQRLPKPPPERKPNARQQQTWNRRSSSHKGFDEPQYPPAPRSRISDDKDQRPEATSPKEMPSKLLQPRIWGLPRPVPPETARSDHLQAEPTTVAAEHLRGRTAVTSPDSRSNGKSPKDSKTWMLRN